MVAIERLHWERLSRYGIEHEEWLARVRELFSWVHEPYARRHGKRRWADKSPGYALILDFVDALYPDCQVVHVVRDPCDVIDSWRRRWGLRRAREAVRAWPSHVSAARDFARRHPEDRCREIRYEELVASPDATVRALLGWLGEPWDEAVMQFDPSPLDGSAAPRPGGGSAISTTSVGIGHRPANRPYLLELHLRSGSLVRELGY